MQTECGGVECVDAVLRRGAGMCRNSFIGDLFRHTSNVRSTVNYAMIGRGRVDHKSHINAIEITAVEELGLATHKVYFAFFDQILAEFDLNQLLGGYGTEPDPARHAVEYTGLSECRRYTKKSGRLRTVSAGMYRTRHGVGVGMLAADDGIKLA